MVVVVLNGDVIVKNSICSTPIEDLVIRMTASFFSSTKISVSYVSGKVYKLIDNTKDNVNIGSNAERL